MATRLLQEMTFQPGPTWNMDLHEWMMVSVSKLKDSFSGTHGYSEFSMQLRVTSERNLKKFMDYMYRWFLNLWYWTWFHKIAWKSRHKYIRCSPRSRSIMIWFPFFLNLSHDRKAAVVFLGRSHGHCGNACFCHSCSAMARSSLPQYVGCRPMRLDAMVTTCQQIVTGHAVASSFTCFLPLRGSLNQTLTNTAIPIFFSNFLLVFEL